MPSDTRKAHEGPAKSPRARYSVSACCCGPSGFTSGSKTSVVPRKPPEKRGKNHTKVDIVDQIRLRNGRSAASPHALLQRRLLSSLRLLGKGLARAPKADKLCTHLESLRSIAHLKFSACFGLNRGAFDLFSRSFIRYTPAKWHVSSSRTQLPGRDSPLLCSLLQQEMALALHCQPLSTSGAFKKLP